MYTCESCHEKDRITIRCSRKWRSHSAFMLSTCDICGKRRHVVHCFNYRLLQTTLDATKELEEKFKQLSKDIKERGEAKNDGMLEMSSKGSDKYPL
jgi:hypothetical protein